MDDKKLSEEKCNTAGDSEWCIANIESLNNAVCNLNCPLRQDTECVKCVANQEKKHEFSLNLILKCVSCNSMFSDKLEKINHLTPMLTMFVSHLFKVNERFVFLGETGLSYAALCKFCAVSGKPMAKSVCQKKKKEQAKVVGMIVGSGEDSLKQTVERLKAAHVDLDPDFDGCITVSFDGSWHKRGHTSKYGLGVVIDALTGLVMDHEVLNKYCHACNWNKTVLGEHSV